MTKVDLLPDFDERRVNINGVDIRVRTAGAGPAVVLLHGYPQTLTMWHRVAPALSKDSSVVLADLRGYGQSDKPESDPGHLTYSKRSMAQDVVGVMDQLGYESFSVVGHDRGGRVGHRLALDHPDRVRSLAVLDIVPTLHMFDHVDRAMASTYFHWFFLAAQNRLPEQLISANPEAWISSRFLGRNSGGLPLHDEAYAEYLQAFHDPRTVHASCEDYRAAATIDLEHDRADVVSGRQIEQPFCVLWGTQSYVGRNFDVLSIWAQFAGSVEGVGIYADHYLAEEAPEQTQAVLAKFLGEAQR